MSVDHNFRELIVERARTVFSQYGLKKTTMDEIAQSVFKAKSSIYYYFKSKEEIYIAVLELENSIKNIELIDVIECEDSAYTKLKAFTISRMKMFVIISNYYHSIKNSSSENYPFVLELKNKFDAEELNILTSILLFGVKSGEILIEDINLYSLAIRNALKGFEFPLSHPDGEQKITLEISTLLDIIFSGLSKK